MNDNAVNTVALLCLCGLSKDFPIQNLKREYVEHGSTHNNTQVKQVKLIIFYAYQARSSSQIRLNDNRVM